MSRREVRYKIAAKRAPDFAEEFLVECPKCEGCALLIPMGEHDEGTEDEPRPPDATMNPKYLHCYKCGFDRSWKPGDLSFLRTLVNWFGELPLFLRAQCGDQVIWALNAAHLDFMLGNLAEISDGALAPPPPLQDWLEDHSPDEVGEALSQMHAAIAAAAAK